jgi:hypothetical protein
MPICRAMGEERLMKTILRTVSSTLLVVGAVLCILISRSDAAVWTVTKTSGAVQKISLGSGFQLDGGDQITTRPNGRVILAPDEGNNGTAMEAADQLS